MRDVPNSILSAWNHGNFIGDQRAIARVTIQHPTMKLRNYSMIPLEVTQKASKIKKIKDRQKAINKGKVNQTYADFFFTTMGIPKELPNVSSVQWTRSLDSDVADCTITLWNTRPLAIGEKPTAGDLDVPGWYTYDRGGSALGRSRWGHAVNEWFGMLVPDNIIRTYEGYGFDPSAVPELDSNLVQTGTWLIDTVEMTSDALITIKCRDVGRLLLDQMAYEPVVPKDFYDHGFSGFDPLVNTTSNTLPGTKLRLTPQDSSNTPWIGSGTVSGHKLAWAFDGDPNTYWLSIGNDRPSRRFAYEWVQAKVGNQSVSQIRFRTKKKGYTAYISLMVDGQWIGSNTIDYHEDGIGMNGADIAYSKTVNVNTEKYITVTLPKPVAKVQAIRVTLGNLQNFNFGTYKYRGGIRDVLAYGPSKTTKKSTTTHPTGPAGENPGHYVDYTDIVKLACAWGGFFCPNGARRRISNLTGTYNLIHPGALDTATLGKSVKGRVWGDFDPSGTVGPAELEWSNFDKKPLMDMISFVRDILGFIFYIDEFGSANWRLPNVFRIGNHHGTLTQSPGYKPRPHVVDERSVLMDLSATIDSKNVRESIFVGQVDGKIGAFAPGFNPNPTGIRRMAGFTDQNFASIEECQRMADMITLAQLYTYRTDRIKIPANPAIQVDDQIRILERTTAEGYVHYVNAISSSLSMESGEWTYDIDTHWLGYDPTNKWIFTVDQLSEATQNVVEEQLRLYDISGEGRDLAS